MFRIIKQMHEQKVKTYEIFSKYENDHNLKDEIESGLSSVFVISQNLPKRKVTDFWSHEDFSVSESFEELEVSYALIKYGFYKQAMIALRSSLEIGLFSIYWSIKGKDSNEFQQWYLSKVDTPFLNNNFWEILKSETNIDQFNKKFNLRSNITEVRDFLSNFTHTKGILYSNHGKLQRSIKGQDEIEDFKIWLQTFKQIVQFIEILHLLKFPAMCLCHQYSTDFLLSKFGTFEKIPEFGFGHANEMRCVFSFIPPDQKDFILELSRNDAEVKEIIEYLHNLPDLSEAEMKNYIIEEQKNHIKQSGFESWIKNINYHNVYKYQIDSEMVDSLLTWSKENNLINLDAIIQNIKNKKNLKDI